uniref:Uncharacterized protein n=1 Tax=Oryza rufipogon TaxID=4529 RepID=A0A0E0P8I7_ORYRU
SVRIVSLESNVPNHSHHLLTPLRPLSQSPVIHAPKSRPSIEIAASHPFPHAQFALPLSRVQPLPPPIDHLRVPHPSLHAQSPLLLSHRSLSPGAQPSSQLIAGDQRYTGVIALASPPPISSPPNLFCAATGALSTAPPVKSALIPRALPPAPSPPCRHQFVDPSHVATGFHPTASQDFPLPIALVEIKWKVEN